MSLDRMPVGAHRGPEGRTPDDPRDIQGTLPEPGACHGAGSSLRYLHARTGVDSWSRPPAARPSWVGMTARSAGVRAQLWDEVPSASTPVGLHSSAPACRVR